MLRPGRRRRMDSGSRCSGSLDENELKSVLFSLLVSDMRSARSSHSSKVSLWHTQAGGLVMIPRDLDEATNHTSPELRFETMYFVIVQLCLHK